MYDKIQIKHVIYVLAILNSLFMTGCSHLHHNSPQKLAHFSYEKPIDCSGNIPIIAHWGAGWHTSLVIPKNKLDIGHYFSDFEFIEINWGDYGFYKAGSNQLSQILAAPKALLLPSSSVMYIVGRPKQRQLWCNQYNKSIHYSETDKLLLSEKNSQENNINICSKMIIDNEIILSYFDGIVIWITPADYDAIVEIVNNSFKLDINSQSIDIGNGYLFDPVYSTVGRFFESNKHYYGAFQTCNTYTAQLLGEIESIKSFKNTLVFRSDTIFKFLIEQNKKGNKCVQIF